MKNIVLLLLLFLQVVAAAVVAVGPLPAPEFADTEVSTNFVFSVGEGQNRGLVFEERNIYVGHPPVFEPSK